MISESGIELLLELNRTGKPELLKELFYQKTKEWPFHLMSIESGTFGLFSNVKLNTSQSFDLIPTAMELCFEQQNPDLLATALSLMEQCIRMADTTEKPAILSGKWPELENKVNEMGNKNCSMYLEDIKSWYRE
jgi:hypothetical protein